jgi:hypothetical protein
LRLGLKRCPFGCSRGFRQKPVAQPTAKSFQNFATTTS